MLLHSPHRGRRCCVDYLLSTAKTLLLNTMLSLSSHSQGNNAPPPPLARSPHHSSPPAPWLTCKSPEPSGSKQIHVCQSQRKRAEHVTSSTMFCGARRPMNSRILCTSATGSSTALPQKHTRWQTQAWSTSPSTPSSFQHCLANESPKSPQLAAMLHRQSLTPGAVHCRQKGGGGGGGRTLCTK